MSKVPDLCYFLEPKEEHFHSWLHTFFAFKENKNEEEIAKLAKLKWREIFDKRVERFSTIDASSRELPGTLSLSWWGISALSCHVFSSLMMSYIAPSRLTQNDRTGKWSKCSPTSWHPRLGIARLVLLILFTDIFWGFHGYCKLN